MCYSAKVIIAWKTYARQMGVTVDVHAFYRLFFAWANGDTSIRIPKSVVDAFDRAEGGEEAAIVGLIDQRKAADSHRLHEEIFAQRKRLADNQRVLTKKPTKTASENVRIATNRIAAAQHRLADLDRAEPQDDDGRIFPGWYAPVFIVENGKKIVRPMRYQCRPAGKPVDQDQKFPGTYNARRDNLRGYWKDLFGKTHGIAVVTTFYEHVERDGRKAILEFAPQDGKPMFIACLWSHWTAPGQHDLLSFAAVTDEPPPEVAAAGHDRCIIPLTSAGVEAWLHPERLDPVALDRVLDTHRVRPYYEHRLAA